MKFTLNVIPRTKKNSSQIIYAGGRPRLIPSKQYREFEEACLGETYEKNVQKKKIDYPVNIKAIFYMPTKRKVDLTNLLEALDDVLVKARIITDDNRDIVASHDGSIVMYDKNNPRIDVEIMEKENYEIWKAK